MAAILDELTEDVAEPASDLDAYRNQARELREALAKVKDLQSQTAAVTRQREAVLSQRQTLLDSFEDEKAVAELSKLGTRVEMHEAKLKTLAARLTGAEAELKAAMATAATSFHSLYMSLRTFLRNAFNERIRAMLHPSVRLSSGGKISELLALATEAIDFEPLAVNPEPGITMPNNTFPPEAIQRAAEWLLPKVEPLLLEAGKHPGFELPPPFSLERWRESVRAGVSVPA